jgi:hypothetical protein
LIPLLSACTRNKVMLRPIIPGPGPPKPGRPFLGSPTPGISSTAERAIIECIAHIMWLTGHNPTAAFAILPSGQRTLQDRLSRLVPTPSWAVTHVLTTDEGYAIASAIRVGMLVSLSDGSPPGLLKLNRASIGVRERTSHQQPNRGSSVARELPLRIEARTAAKWLESLASLL